MNEQEQSQGRKDNAAAPVDEWEAKGVAGQTDQKQKDDVERTGRGEEQTFQAETPDPNDLTGPAGDPAEGKRPGGSSYPA